MDCACAGAMSLQDALLKPLRSKFPGLPDYKLREALETTKNRWEREWAGTRMGTVDASFTVPHSTAWFWVFVCARAHGPG